MPLFPATSPQRKRSMTTSIYERLGGEPAIDAAVDIFYRKVLVDERISHFFDAVNMDRQRAKQKAFLTFAFGGPVHYSGQDMRAAHAKMKLTDAHFNAVMENLAATLTELKVPPAHRQKPRRSPRACGPRSSIAPLPLRDRIRGEALRSAGRRDGARLPAAARVAVSSFCRAGACQSCLLRAPPDSVPVAAQVGLKASWKQQGYFLSCLCSSAGDLKVERCDSAAIFPALISRVERIADDIVRVMLTKPDGFELRAGQFLQLVRPHDDLMRPYSIASTPEAPELELHVAMLPNGEMSGWLRQSAGAEVRIRGPFGECFYQEEEPTRPIVLAGTGTGLAPLLGILRAAADRAHRGAIALFHGSLRSEGLYLRAELEELGHEVTVTHIDGERTRSITRRAWRSWALATGESAPRPARYFKAPQVARASGVLCGNPDIVRRLRKLAYLAGASLDRIHSDAFAMPARAPANT